jgi:hypothetical protein
MSPNGLVGLAEREAMAITHRSGRRGVAAAELDAYLERCRIPPGRSGPELAPYKRRSSPAQVRHVDLLESVVSCLSWTDARLARHPRNGH